CGSRTRTAAERDGSRRLHRSRSGARAGSPTDRRSSTRPGVEDRRTIRVVQLPTGPSSQIAGSSAEEYGATVSPTGRLAFVSTRSGSPTVYVAQPNGSATTLFDVTPSPVPFKEVHDLAWSPDGSKLAYDADLQDGT